jgi:hypothetical protein
MAEAVDPWWWRIRRSYGVPDLVTDEHARTIILGELAAADSTARGPVAKTALESVLELGKAGHLDVFLVGEKRRKRWLEGLGTEAKEAVLRALDDHAKAHLPKALTKGAQTRSLNEASVIEVASELRSKIEAHVSAWPFEDDNGRYFSAPDRTAEEND